MVEGAAQDYSKLLQSVSLDKEINPICIGIDDMLTRLDELESVLVKSETDIVMDNYVIGILGFESHFEKLKQRIDELEKFVEVVNNNIDTVEKSIEIAEAELNVPNYTLKNLLLKPLLTKTKSVSELNSLSPTEESLTISTNLKEGKYQAVPIFKSSVFFNTEIS